MDDKEVFARAMPPPMDVAVDGHFAGKLTPNLLWEMKGWVALPMVSLGLAGFLALLLAVSRIPGAEAILPWTGQEFFRRGLVAHVTFAFVVWYMGVHGALTVLATAQSLGDTRADVGPFGVIAGRLALGVALVSLLLLLIPVLANLGVPTLNNYVPVLDHPLYYSGLALLAVSVAIPVVRLLLQLARRRYAEAGTFAVAAAGVMYLIALGCVAAAWFTMPPNVGIEGANEYLMWGGGHVLQFANTALMLVAFYFLMRVTLGETPLAPGWFKIMMLVLVAGAAVGPLLYVTYPGGPVQRAMFTSLYWYALPLPTAVVMISVVRLMIRRWRHVVEGAPEVKAVGTSLVLFAVGGIIGFFEGSVDTRTPSHYHAMLIAVALAFIALYFALLLPLLGRRTDKRRLRTAMYVLLGGGQLLHSLGLYLAGVEGVARKTAGAAQELDSVWKIVSMSLMGAGGVIAVAGGVIFIFLAGRMLLAKGGRGVTPGALNTPRAAP